jgi:hypothetical protein
MRLNTLVVVVVVGFCVPGASPRIAEGGVPPDAVCKDKKGLAAGGYSRNLLRAFAVNRNTPNVTQLATNISMAQSRMSRRFTRAEFTMGGESRGCETIGDVGAIRAAGDVYTNTVLCDLNPGCPSTDPANPVCKRRKAINAGGFAFRLLQAFGTNRKVPNISSLATSISQAQSRLTRTYTRAEFTLAGVSNNCDTVGDVANIEAEADAYVSDVLCQLDFPCPSPSGAFVEVPSGALE